MDVFEDQMRGWYLAHAWILEGHRDSGQHSGFAVLSILMGYFEAIGKLEAGRPERGDSKKYFWEGFLSVFQDLPDAIGDASLLEATKNTLYDELRCGLYHRLMTGPRIVLERMEPVLEVRNSKDGVTAVRIDPFQILRGVDKHLEAYMRDLRNPSNTELRANFVAAFRW